MAEFIIILLLYFIAFGAIGLLIGQKKRRPLAGLVWAMLLGPLGWALVFFGPDGPERQSPYALSRQPLRTIKSEKWD
ncbi:hypothetical protein [Ideonella sp.]|uniref:hypothetical protein n=1 Tax=Ideonella sp. TaxID=1929293 RepID=UPI003BB54F4F